MKISTSFFSLLFLVFLLSCSTDDNNSEITGSSGISYKDSKASWPELKKINGESYSYTTRFDSWTGFSNKTIITVQDGVVIKREYFAYETSVNPEGEVVEELDSYTETGEEIGTHERGFKPLLVEELYETCISEYLTVNEEENKIYFDTDEDGIISNCGFVPKGCVDDCFSGFRIDEFKWL